MKSTVGLLFFFLRKGEYRGIRPKGPSSELMENSSRCLSHGMFGSSSSTRYFTSYEPRSVERRTQTMAHPAC